MSELLLYVYGIIPAPAAAPSPRPGWGEAGLVGIGGASVGLVSEGPIAAVVSAVPAEEFDEQPLNSRLRDLEWLSPRAAKKRLRQKRHVAAPRIGLPPGGPVRFLMC